jgi:methyl-accepting chemotaxis protein
MKRTLTLQQKILFLIIGTSVVIYALAIGYISVKAKRAAMDDAITVTKSTAEKYASDIKSLLEEDLVAMQTLSKSVLSYKLMPEDRWKEVFGRMYFEIINDNPQFLAIWDSWELSHIDPSYTKPYGRYVKEFWREGQQIKNNFSLKSMTGDNADYARIKKNAIDCIENPYFYSYSGNENEQLLMTSLISPIVENGKYIGVVGVDITLDRYHPIISQIRPFDGSYAFLVANDLQYVAHPDKSKHGQKLLQDYESTLDRYGATQKIINGEECSFLANDLNGVKSFFFFTPIIIGKTGTPWSLAIVAPRSTILRQANYNFIVSIIVGIIGLLILSTLTLFATRSIVVPIQKITSILKRMAQGDVSNDMKLPITTEDEIGQMANALNTTIDGLNQKVVFATNIGKDNLDSSFNTLSNKDTLGKALIDMRQSLKIARAEEEMRKIEDSRRQWANEGLAKFAEILRKNNDNMDKLSRSIIKEIVETLQVNQGGLFLFNDDDRSDPFFELTAAYAYNRFKFKQKKILPGEGLVGASALEKKTIYLTEIPEGYLEITSGLGKTDPKALLITPLTMEDNVLGVIELASFNLFEEYQIEFLERLAQTIASTITAVKVNIRTSLLLAKTQQQAEEMLAQEEEMRQNMEELQATQEESTRKSSEMQSFIDALHSSSFVIEYDALGYITSINNAYLELLGLTRDEVVGTHHSDKLDLKDEKKREYEMMWNDLRNGIPHKQVNRFIVNERAFVFQETYTPIKNEQGEVYKILKISNNITNLVIGK